MARVVIAALAIVAAATLYGGFNEVRLALFVDWPPRFARPFPDVALVDHRGAEFRISDLAGQVVIVHAAAMPSPAANAFAGGQALGGMGGVRPQVGLRSLDFYLARHGGARLGDPGLALAHLLLYDMEGGAPSAADAAAWAEHFRFDGQLGVYAAVPAGDLRGRASAALLPGVYLVGKDGYVRYESAGRRPRHDLLRELLPAVAELLAK